MAIPAGMSPETFEYVLRFTMAHEGETPFMYNNWPLKNPKKDVTVGVGIAINNEAEAVRPDILGLFRVKATGAPATPDDMKREFRRVVDLPRTRANLFTDYRDKSPLEIPPDRMLSSLTAKMLSFWEQRGQNFPNFATMPAQAQAALMSWNYGLRLASAPKMCNAVRGGDFTLAAKESFISGWDGQKNEAHKRLLLNAAAIVREGIAPGTLPPPSQFKPPAAVSPSVAAAGAATAPLPQQLAGRWNVTIGGWRGIFLFDAKGGVSWAESKGGQTHPGGWSLSGSRLEWKFRDPGDFRTFTVTLPLNFTNTSGTILPAGQGWFSMSKSG